MFHIDPNFLAEEKKAFRRAGFKILQPPKKKPFKCGGFAPYEIHLMESSLPAKKNFFKCGGIN